MSDLRWDTYRGGKGVHLKLTHLKAGHVVTWEGPAADLEWAEEYLMEEMAEKLGGEE